jgi:hypothetical protein
MQDKVGARDRDGKPIPRAWFIPIIPLDAENYRGLIKDAGRLGIHPDGPTKSGGRYFDGTAGCIGIREADTSDLHKLFEDLGKAVKTGSKTDISRFLRVSSSVDFHIAPHCASLMEENSSPYGNRPIAVSVLLKS